MENGIFDIGKIKEIMGDDRDALISFFKLFKEQTKLEIAGMEKYIRENKRDKVSATAHKLKSTYGSIGSADAYDLLAEIETRSKTEPFDESVSDLFEQFKNVHNKILEEIDKYSVS